MNRAGVIPFRYDGVAALAQFVELREQNVRLVLAKLNPHEAFPLGQYFTGFIHPTGVYGPLGRAIAVLSNS